MTKKHDENAVACTGTCVFCVNDELPLYWRGDELMCDECRNHFNEEDAINEHDQVESLKYMAQEAEEWLPEHGYDDEEDS